MRKLIALSLFLILCVPIGMYVLAQDVAIGETVTIQGEVEDIVSENAFRLDASVSEQFNGNDVLVFPGPDGDFAIDINRGIQTLVTGEVLNFDEAELENQLGLELNDSAMSEFTSEDYAIVASSVQRLPALAYWDEQRIQDFQGDPTAFYNEPITVDGRANIVSPNAFRLTETDPFTLSSDVLVFPGQSDEFSVDINNGRWVQVRGELVPFDLADVENRLGTDLDDSAFADYGTDDHAIVATDVTALRARDLTDPNVAADVEANPDAYLNQVLVVDGQAEIVSPNVFRLAETDPFSLSSDLLVLPGMDSQFAIDINNARWVQVVGELVQFDIAELEQRSGLDLDDERLSEFDNSDYALIALRVSGVDEAEANRDQIGFGFDTETMGTDAPFGVIILDDAEFPFADVDPYDLLDNITDNPEQYYGAWVTVAGDIEEQVANGSGGFVIEEDDLIGDDPALVIGATADMVTAGTWADEDTVMVTGVVRPLVIPDLEAELGYDLDDTLYQGYEGYPAIIAHEVRIADQAYGD